MALAYQKKHADYVPSVNSYVPAMQFAADIMEGGNYVVNFGSPPAASTSNILATTAQDSAVDVGRSSFVSGGYLAEARFGAVVRCIGTTTDTAAVNLYGRDCYGQPMRETITLTDNVAVNGVKCFKTIDRITCGASASDTFSVGWGAIWGLPYKTTHCLGEIADGVPAAAGTVTAPVLTDPQTATTGDPRGRYTPTTTPDGSKDITAFFIADNSVNASGNGGLMGIAHYYA